MRRASKTDKNHAEIVKGLREYGARVESLAHWGNGRPDIICGYRWLNWLLEIKQPGEDLRQNQTEWHEDWKAFGQVATVRSLQEAIAVITGPVIWTPEEK